MYKIDNSTASLTRPASTAAGTAGWFTDGSPGGGVPATILPAEWLNAVQDELDNVVVQAGMTLNKATSTQLRDAILSIIQTQATGRLLNMRAFVSTQAYTPTIGTKNVRIRQWSSGGGGGGGTAASPGGGGGAGGYLEWYGPLSLLGAGPTYLLTVGSQGTGGAIGVNGVSGGSSNVASLLTCVGGTGGGNGATPNGGNGGASTATPAGALVLTAGREGNGVFPGIASAGSGGGTFGAVGGVPHNAAGGAGSNPAGGGAGGASAASGGGAVTAAGGGGGSALTIIEEYA